MMDFNPSSFTESKNGVCKVPEMMAKYLIKYFRQALQKPKLDEMLCNYLRSDVELAFPPKVDKYVKDFAGTEAGTHFPK